jgi:hypothetical protein
MCTYRLLDRGTTEAWNWSNKHKPFLSFFFVWIESRFFSLSRKCVLQMKLIYYTTRVLRVQLPNLRIWLLAEFPRANIWMDSSSVWRGLSAFTLFYDRPHKLKFNRIINFQSFFVWGIQIYLNLSWSLLAKKEFVVSSWFDKLNNSGTHLIPGLFPIFQNVGTEYQYDISKGGVLFGWIGLRLVPVGIFIVKFNWYVAA